MSKYDYLIVGAGLFGAVAAYRAARSGKKALVIDRRPHTGGNAYCEEREGIRVHKYGAHIFHTSNREVWEFVNRFVEFNNYINSPVANYKGKLYNLPFNMNTFYAMWGVTTPAQAAEMIDRQRREAGISEPRNLEEQAISLVGIDIYERLVKGYTENSGDATPPNCRHSSSNACRCASPSTTTTSTTAGRVSPSAATTNSWTDCSQASRCAAAPISSPTARTGKASATASFHGPHRRILRF